MSKTNTNFDNDNQKTIVFALDVFGKEVHISEVEGGKKGYYCIGCGKQMQAKHSPRGFHISYFSHDPTDVKLNGSCSHSDETYRHGIAKEILQIIKSIRTPAVYKYPAKGEEGKAYQIDVARIVAAAEVIAELYFYERENGEIGWSKTVNFKDKYLLFKPDIAFFNEIGKPILLIELVATHKVSDDKKVKIRRLGIDAVQVSISKGTRAEIENIFSTTERTKWIYNNDEANTKYIPTSSGHTEAISFTDEFQRKFFEESLSCRTTEIGNLIRSITRCLESEQYLEYERRIGGELQRVKGNKERERRELLEIHNGIRDSVRKRVDRKYEVETEHIIEEERKQEDLEGRYFRKREEIQQGQEQIDRKFRRVEERRGEIENDTREIINAIQDEQRTEQNLKRDREWVEERGRTNDKTVREEENKRQSEIEQSEKRIRVDIKRVKQRRIDIRSESKRIRETSTAKFGKLESNIRTKIEGESIDRIELTEQFKRDEDELGREFGNFRKELVQSVKKRMPAESERLSRKLQKFFHGLELLEGFPDMLKEIERIRNAKKSIETRAYKNWNE